MIQKLFVVDHVIKITRTEVGDTDPPETQYISEPSKFSYCSWFGLLKADIFKGEWNGTCIPYLKLKILWQTKRVLP